MRFVYVLVINLLLWLGLAGSAQALTMAVFPIEDLSQGQNGVNEELTDYLAWDMNRRGYDVIAKETVISFMARNRVRWLGFLDTRHILLAKEEMGADLVMFGTMSLREEKLSPSFGLNLYLVRTSDTKTLWTGSGGLGQQDIVNLLGINEPKNGEGLLARLAQNVLASWPEELEYSSKPQHALEIEDIALQPTHVRRGDKVTCSVQLRTTWAEEDAPRIFFKAAGRVYMARNGASGDTFIGDWEVAENDGRYPVTMVINWPSGHKKVSFLGAYNVDNSPPKLVLDLKGVQLEGTVAFRDQVIIIPRMLRREPVARWKLKVEDESGEEQMSYNGYGEMPKRFVWNGRGKDGWPVEEGIYKVSLMVWDMAENLSVATQPVAVARTPPAMVLEAKNRGRDMIVDLSNDGRVPIAFWRVEMRSSDGELIKVAEGSDLPVQMDVNIPSKVIKVADGLVPPVDDGSRVIKVADGIDMPAADGKRIIKVADGVELPIVDNRRIIKVAGGAPLQMDVQAPEDKDTRKVECTVIMRDILGNQTKTRIKDLVGYAAEKELKDLEQAGTPVWLEEF